MSRIAAGCLGMETILVAMSAPFAGVTRRLRQRNGRGHADLVAGDGRGVSLARRVLDEAGVPRAEYVLRAVAQTDLELPGEDDHELTARRGVPVEELPSGPLAKRDLARGKPLEPIGLRLEVDRLDVRLLIRARVQPKCPHRSLRRVIVNGTGGMLA